MAYEHTSPDGKDNMDALIEERRSQSSAAIHFKLLDTLLDQHECCETGLESSLIEEERGRKLKDT